jgi:hypothetical protein
MRLRTFIWPCLLVLSLSVLAGCARAARDTTGFADEQSITVNAPFEDTWQTVKTVLREQGYELYTRDKRGVFVAYTPMKRRLIQPQRTQYTITLADVTSTQTTVHVETIAQIYGVTLLTYPDWHDRPVRNTEGAAAILSAVQTRLSGGAL